MLTALLVSLSLMSPHQSKPLTPSRCQTQACHHRVWTKHRRKVVRPWNQWLNQTAECESGGDWRTNTGNGFFGGLQFLRSTWQGVGGRGWPHLASELEQKYRGVLVLRVQGKGAWPICGRH